MHAPKRALTIMVLISSIALAGCGAGDDAGSTTDATPESPTPAPLQEGEPFRVCTSVPYEPAEMLEDGEFVGYEIDIMNEIAGRLDTTAAYVSTPFDDLISTLDDKGCDAIMSSMTVTEARSSQVSFVEYMIAGAGPEDAATSNEDDVPRLGIATRKADDELNNAIQVTVDDMYDDGTMVKLLEQWDAANYVLPERS